MTERKFDIAILGATGLIGETMIDILAESSVPVGELYLLATEASVGESRRFRGRAVTVRDAASSDWSRAQLALLSAGADASGAYAPKAAAACGSLIDSSSRLRDGAARPLVVPEVNAPALADPA